MSGREKTTDLTIAMAAGPNKPVLINSKSICLSTILGKFGGRRGSTVTGPVATKPKPQECTYIPRLAGLALEEELKMASDVYS